MKIKVFAVLVSLVALASVAFAQMPEAVKFEEFEDINCEEYLARMDYVIHHAQSNPYARMYVLVYEGKTKRYKHKKEGGYDIVSVLPQRGLAKARISSMKKYLGVRRFPVEGFVFIEAGLRENFAVEIWRVPNGATPPKPTPAVTTMKYRKGKATGFCLGCCEP